MHRHPRAARAASTNDAASAPRQGNSRRTALLGALLGVLVLLCAASLVIGSVLLPPGAVWHALGSRDGSNAATIVQGVRVPRTIAGIVVGLALGAAGALMQGHTRNPLGEPGVLGVTAGAALAVVLALFGLGVRAPGEQVWFAILGAAAATLVVMAVTASARDGTGPVPLALSGAAVSALLTTVTSFLVLSDASTLDTYRRWVVGSLSGREAGVVGQVLPFVVAGLILAFGNTRTLDLLGMGSDVARGLGQRLALGRVVGLSAITLLTAAATAIAGPIMFLGLVVPHLARQMVGVSYRWILPCSALLGAVLLLAADVVCRLIPGEPQVGIALAMIGAPVFLVIVRGRRVLSL